MLYLISPFFSALLIGTIIAFAIEPFHRRLAKKGIPRKLAAALIVVAFFVLVLTPVILLVTKGSQNLMAYLQAHSFVQTQGQVNTERIQLSLDRFEERLSNAVGLPPGYLSSFAGVSIEQIGDFTIGAVKKFLQNIPELSLNLIMILLTVFFGLAEKTNIDLRLKQISPFPRERMDRLTGALQRSSSTVIVTTLVGGIAQAAVFGIGTIVFGTGNFLLAVFSVFLLSFVPIVGTAPLTVALVGNYFMSGNSGLALGWFIVGAIAATIDNVVRTLVINAGVNIHPFIGFITVVGGVITFGIPGLFLGPFIAGLFTTVLPILLETSDA